MGGLFNIVILAHQQLRLQAHLFYLDIFPVHTAACIIPCLPSGEFCQTVCSEFRSTENNTSSSDSPLIALQELDIPLRIALKFDHKTLKKHQFLHCI